MKAFSNRNPITIAVVGLVVMVLAIVAALNTEDLPIIGGGTTYTANVQTAAGLRSGDSVRIAGVKVGKVTDLSLAGDHVEVRFTVRDAFVGDKSEAAIKIQTLLGSKYLAVESRGNAPLDPSQPIGEDSAESVNYDVVAAFNGLSRRVGAIDTGQLAKSFQVLSETFHDTPADVRSALQGLSRLSDTIASRRDQLSRLLANTSRISRTLSDRNAAIKRLIGDGSVLLAEVQRRKQAISALLTGTQQLAREVTGLVNDNQAQLKPVLTELNQLTTMLRRNRDSLAAGLRRLAPFARLFTNTLGNGRWFDSYVCGLLPPSGGPVNTYGCDPGNDKSAGGH